MQQLKIIINPIESINRESINDDTIAHICYFKKIENEGVFTCLVKFYNGKLCGLNPSDIPDENITKIYNELLDKGEVYGYVHDIFIDKDYKIVYGTKSILTKLG